jgi:hypothetical protein
MAPRTDDTPPRGVIGATTLHKNRFTINCARCGTKQTVSATDRSDAWAALQEQGWVAYADVSSPRPTHAACPNCLTVNE